jgi:hypothetical protein
MVDLQELEALSRSSLRFQVMKLMADTPVWRADQRKSQYCDMETFLD